MRPNSFGTFMRRVVRGDFPWLGRGKKGDAMPPHPDAVNIGGHGYHVPMKDDAVTGSDEAREGAAPPTKLARRGGRVLRLRGRTQGRVAKRRKTFPRTREQCPCGSDATHQVSRRTGAHVFNHGPARGSRPDSMGRFPSYEIHAFQPNSDEARLWRR